MSADAAKRPAEELRRAILDFLAARQSLSFPPETILERITRAGALDFAPEPDEFAAALTFLEDFTPEPLIAHKMSALGASRFYRATSAGVLAWERGALNP
ncbi:MAG TPA: hypothetical protein VL981_08235 [Candidatus Methylacidiphilales bacterium]|nr:hypothetical protein [Candidatus Methylacidiphilales bacterium]